MRREVGRGESVLERVKLQYPAIIGSKILVLLSTAIPICVTSHRTVREGSERGSDCAVTSQPMGMGGQGKQVFLHQ